MFSPQKGRGYMNKKPLNELNLMDNFLFGSVVTYPGIGEEFSRKLLKIIFGRDFGKLRITPQKVYYGSHTGLHGARLDVYIEEDEEALVSGDVATVYDVEPEKNETDAAVKALPKRVRFYHAKIDTRSLRAGETYKNLKNVIIIMMVPFDPFGLDRMVYTIKSGCIEEPDMPYEDGARTLFLYTKGTKGNPSKELQELLKYMEYTNAQNATNHDLQEIHRMIETVKYDAGVTGDYMRLMEDEEVLLERGTQRGIQKSIIKLLEIRFPISVEIREKICAQEDLKILDEWLLIAAKATSIEDFTSKISCQ